MAKVKVNNAWKEVGDIHVKVGGQWKTVSDAYEKKGGSWKEIYSSFKIGTLEETPWEVIASLPNPSKYFDVGDEKTITLTTGKDVVFQIYGISDFDEEYEKEIISLGLKDCFSTTQSAYIEPPDGYFMPLHLSLSAPTNILPQEIKNNGVLKDGFVLKKADVNGGSSSFPIFTDNASRVKRLDGVVKDWWLKDYRRAGDNTFYISYVRSSGSFSEESISPTFTGTRYTEYRGWVWGFTV